MNHATIKIGLRHHKRLHMVIIPYIMPPLPLAMVKIHRWTSGSLLVAEQCIHTSFVVSWLFLHELTRMATGRVKEASVLVEGLLVLLF